MKAIEKNMVAAVFGGYDWRESNTEVTNTNGAIIVRLHGNIIYRKTPAGIKFSDGGYPSATTASRLRALGANITFKKSQNKIIFND